MGRGVAGKSVQAAVGETAFKKCRRCGAIKDSSAFYKDLTVKSGLSGSCKPCILLAAKARYTNNREMKIAASLKWRKENYDRCRETARVYACLNREHINKLSSEWRQNNKEKVKLITKRKDARRLKIPSVKLSRNISGGIAQSIRSGSKNGRHWEALVNFTIEQLKDHLEKRFVMGMSWDNYGTHWHIDHVIPISAHNFETPEDTDFRRCWSLKNLQPLWARENISKKDKLTEPFQPSLVM
jgi:hypothetical protein